MSKEISKPGEVEVINAHTANLIDRAKVYLTAEVQTERQRWMFLFLTGACLQQLKEGCQHGQFENLKEQHFPDVERSRLGRAMMFSEAVQFFAKSKYPSIGHLTSGDRLLSAGELSDKEKAALVEDVTKATKGKGVMETIGDWRKKIHKEKNPTMKPTAAEVAEQKMKAASEFVEELRSKMALALKNKNLALVPDAELDALEDDRIELGHYIASLRKGRKTKKN